MKAISLKLTSVGITTGPFTITDQFGNVIATDVTRKVLSNGISYVVDDGVTLITLTSTGKCKLSKTVAIKNEYLINYHTIVTLNPVSACLWRHITDITLYNSFYGSIEPYEIEYPFSYQYQDEILQNIQDYTKAYKYYSTTRVNEFTQNTRVETNDSWFNEAILYNGQQCSGILKLVPKPKNNLQGYMSYPILGTDSKTIVYTKSDNFYQYNTFWSVLKDSQTPMFLTSCENMSIDKILNQDNMDYGPRSYHKSTLRAKELKVRHILNSTSDVHLVSQFIIGPVQNSYK